MIFAVEKVEDCWDEMVALAEGHYAETQGHRHYQGFQPLYERYKQQEDWGSFIQFTARVDGKMVGYGGCYVVPSMHTQAMICTEDTWYLLPEYRKGWNAIKFMRFMEKTAKERGAVDVTITTSFTTAADKVAKFLGYEPVAKVLYKRL